MIIVNFIYIKRCKYYMGNKLDTEIIANGGSFLNEWGDFLYNAWVTGWGSAIISILMVFIVMMLIGFVAKLLSDMFK